MAFFNIKRGTNAVMKLKGVENKRRAMTFKETLVFIYGENYTMTKILFAAYYDDDDWLTSLSLEIVKVIASSTMIS